MTESKHAGVSTGIWLSVCELQLRAFVLESVGKCVPAIQSGLYVCMCVGGYLCVQTVGVRTVVTVHGKCLCARGPICVYLCALVSMACAHMCTRGGSPVHLCLQPVCGLCACPGFVSVDLSVCGFE